MKKVLLSGAKGLVGTHLRDAFLHLGWESVALTREESSQGFVHWDPMSGYIDPAGIEGCDYAVHLAGENIADGRWTKERKRLILESRERGTRLLADALARMDVPPRVLVCASGSNYYRDNSGGPSWNETGPAGEGFMAQVCTRWEAAAEPARLAGIRVAYARMGVVLSTKGGILTRMLPAVCSGLGGVIGNGRQRISWIHADDLVRALVFILQNASLEGPVNVVSPCPVSNRDFTRALADVLHRPSFIKMPRSAIMWIYGEMGAELLLADNAVEPLKLMECGMQWEFPKLDDALNDLLAEHKCWS